MLDFEKVPPDAWRPFGIGVRACIGRAFAEQEMLLNVALILQRFQVEMADPTYDLSKQDTKTWCPYTNLRPAIKSTLTMKPKAFKIKVRRRPGKDSMVGLGGVTTVHAPEAVDVAKPIAGREKSKVVIAYGSNAGTCKAFAEDLQTHAPEFGFEASVITLDQATENIPKGIPFVIITSSYEGKPPDNAKKFISWLEVSNSGSALDGVQYALFGVGNSEWASTYHKVPKLIESLIKKQGAKPICNPFFADVKRDCTGDWENWVSSPRSLSSPFALCSESYTSDKPILLRHVS